MFRRVVPQTSKIWIMLRGKASNTLSGVRGAGNSGLKYIQPPVQDKSWALSAEVKRAGDKADHSTTSSAEVRNM
jgi:hypothetical protein